MVKADTVQGAGQRGLAGLLAGILLLAVPAEAADLKPAAVEGFNRYVQLTEAQIGSQETRHEPFLCRCRRSAVRLLTRSCTRGKW
jgi:hypothetical protein